ncbi:ER lumen protein-retaining receptor 3 [Saguinus oedipus]|uniref:ER lumen protein-retaining receptor n=1 Tax=Saguinus oedipus TaxID=9490 RepID=A0ABQ9WJC5_SAGOE|nr:ER lumen protein-retaining receptor 3 [Saguinus oedipus]
MNVFRILGDLSHLLAMILLLGKIWRSKCCTGISGKSQILFAVVFTTRYLDLFTNFISIYNTVMKVVFLLCAYVTVYMIYGKFRKTFDSENDTFRLEFLLVPVIGLSFLENYSFTPLEILWTFSIYLESVAILPQLFMISKTGEAETITTHYLFFLGLYRALYLANWIRRYQTENFYDQIAVVSGVVQTIFYCDFFYLYVTKVTSYGAVEVVQEKGSRWRDVDTSEGLLIDCMGVNTTAENSFWVHLLQKLLVKQHYYEEDELTDLQMEEKRKGLRL